jgi:hypothetical protein
MSRELIESILNKDYVSANELFEENMSDIQERKLYESKRMMQSEVFGGMTRAQAEKKYRERGQTPRKASDVYGDPRQTKLTPIGTEKKRKAVPSSVKKPKPKSERPGVIQRNVNTLMGREPGYKPEPKTPEQKGGRVGKTIRGVLGVNAAINDYIRRNTGPLEE